MKAETETAANAIADSAVFKPARGANDVVIPCSVHPHNVFSFSLSPLTKLSIYSTTLSLAILSKKDCGKHTKPF